MMRRLVTFKELSKVYGIPWSSQHILRKQKAGNFPMRRKFGNQNFWYAEEIETWINSLPTVQTPHSSNEG
jgi:predicted DNA-binding transcriptional regulator AlpA